MIFLVRNHTPEPWTVMPADNGIACLLSGGRHFANIRPMEPDPDFMDADRVVRCVNACENIRDPDKAHAVARDAIREADVFMEACLTMADQLDRGPGADRAIAARFRAEVAKRRAHLSEAHELLNGGPL